MEALPSTIYTSKYPMETFAIILASLFFLLLILKITKKPKKITKQPPGPWKLPIIGNLHQLAGSVPPHRRLRDLAKQYGPLMHLQIGEISTVVVSSAEYAEQVMKTHDINFASRPYLRASHVLSYNSIDVIFAPYGEYWRELKKICTLELLSAKRVTSFKSIREEEVSKLIKWIGSQAESGTAIDLTEKLYALSNNVICRAAFGKVGRDQQKFLEKIDETAKKVSGFNVADLFPSIEWFMTRVTGMEAKLEKMHGEIDRMIENIVEEHKKGKNGEKDDNNTEVFLDVLLKIQENSNDGFRFTSQHVKAIMWDIIGAGSETSATVLDWAIFELIRNPEIMTNVQKEVREVFNKGMIIDESSIKEMPYLKAILKESLRLHPPAPLLLPRENKETCQINDFEIPKKTKVFINAWAIARDPEYWNEPEDFMPERFLKSNTRIDCGGSDFNYIPFGERFLKSNTRIDCGGSDFNYIPFGAGRRICPGILFGMANIEFPLALLLYYFDWKHPSGVKSENLDPTEEFGAAVRRKKHTKLVPVAYYP